MVAQRGFCWHFHFGQFLKGAREAGSYTGPHGGQSPSCATIAYAHIITRSSISSPSTRHPKHLEMQQRKLDGQRAHRWWRARSQAARPRSGKRENARDTLHRWRRKEGVGGDGKLGGGVFFYFISCQPSKGGWGRGGHIVTGTLGGSVVAGKRGFFLFNHTRIQPYVRRLWRRTC